MSDLTRQDVIVRGWPYGSGLQYSFRQKALESPDLIEGIIVHVADEGGVPVVTVHTSALHASDNRDNPWVVMRGRNQTDAVTSAKITCVKLGTGIMFQVPVNGAEHPMAGNLVYANAGATTIVDPGSAPAFGRVVSYDPVAGLVTIES
jgi:hypothetical protein